MVTELAEAAGEETAENVAEAQLDSAPKEAAFVARADKAAGAAPVVQEADTLHRF